MSPDNNNNNEKFWEPLTCQLFSELSFFIYMKMVFW